MNSLVGINQCNQKHFFVMFVVLFLIKNDKDFIVVAVAVAVVAGIVFWVLQKRECNQQQQKNETSDKQSKYFQIEGPSQVKYNSFICISWHQANWIEFNWKENI